jgi:glucose-6-phosphate 1-epimerase
VRSHLFLSELSLLDCSRPVRGGIPLCFPRFGPGPAPLPQHGFARSSTWKLVKSVAADRSVSVSFRLLDSERSREVCECVSVCVSEWVSVSVYGYV